MQLSENALEASKQVIAQIQQPEETAFFVDVRGQWDSLLPATYEVISFLAKRPTMLLADAMQPDKMLDLIAEECIEAEQADEIESQVQEYADVAFFALLTGILHWDSLSPEKQGYVIDSLSMAQEAVAAENRDLGDEVAKVTRVKNTTNYPAAFLQINPSEKTLHMPKKLGMITKILKNLRVRLNGVWAGAGNLMATLAREWDSTRHSDLLAAGQIGLLFMIARLDIEEYISP